MPCVKDEKSNSFVDCGELDEIGVAACLLGPGGTIPLVEVFCPNE